MSRYSGFQYPDGMAVLDTETGELIFFPLDGGKPRRIREADQVTTLAKERDRASDSGGSQLIAPVPEIITDTHDAPPPRPDSDHDPTELPSRYDDTLPGERRTVLSRERLAPATVAIKAEALPAESPGDDLVGDDLEQLVLTSFPAPIAVSYLTFVDESDPRLACRRLTDTFAVVLKLWTLQVIAEYFAADDVSDDRLNRMLARDLQRPSLRVYKRLLSRGLEVLAEADSRPLYPEIFDTYRRLDGSVESRLPGRETTTEAPQVGPLEALLEYRDRVLRGLYPSRPRAQAEIDIYRPLLNEVLRATRFMARFPLFALQAPRLDSATATGERSTSPMGLPIMGAGSTGAPIDLPKLRFDPNLSSLFFRDEQSDRMLPLLSLAIIDDRVASDPARSAFGGDVFLLDGFTRHALLFTSVSGECIERTDLVDRWWDLLERKRRREVSAPDRSPTWLRLSQRARRITEATLGALIDSGRYLPDVTVTHPAIEERFNELHFGDFRGLFLTGEAGAGKSTALARHAEELLARGHIVLFYQANTFNDADIVGHMARDLALAGESLAELVAVAQAHTTRREAEPDPLIDRHAVYLLIDGLTEYPQDRDSLIGAIASLLDEMKDCPWFRLIGTVRAIHEARLADQPPFSSADQHRLLCVEESCDDGRICRPFVRIAALSEAELNVVVTRYRDYRDAGDDSSSQLSLGGFDPSGVEDALRPESPVAAWLQLPAWLNLGLRAYHQEPLPDRLPPDVVLSHYLDRVVLEKDRPDGSYPERHAFLDTLADHLVHQNAEHALRDDLYRVARLQSALISAERNSPYNQLLERGVLSEDWSGDRCRVSFTSYALLAYLLAKDYAASAGEVATWVELARRAETFAPFFGALEIALHRAIDQGHHAILLEILARPESEGAGRAATYSWFERALARVLYRRQRAQDPEVERFLDALLASPTPSGLRLAKRLIDEARRRDDWSNDRFQQLSVELSGQIGSPSDQASALARLAQLQLKIGDTVSALATLDRAQTVCPRDDDALSRRVDVERGRVLFALGRLDEAGDVIRRLLEHAIDSVPESALSADVKHLSGLLAIELGDAESASRSLLESCEDFERAGLAESALGALGDPAVRRLTSAHPRATRRLLERGYHIATRLGHRATAVAFLDDLAISSARHQPAEALSLLRKALTVSNQLADTGLTARVCGHLGEVTRWFGDYSEARDVLTRGLKAAEEDVELSAWNLAHFAVLQCRMGEHAAAESTLRRAQSLVDETVYDPTFGTVQLMLGHLERDRGRPGEASTHYRLAIERFVAAGDQASHADALVGLARCSTLEGAYDAAKQHLDEVVSMTEESGDVVALAFALRGLSELERTIGPPDRAEPFMERLQELGDRHTNPQWLRHADLERARLDHARGDLESAEARYTRVLEQFNRLNLRSEAARITLDLARLDLDRGEIGRAHTRALASLAFFEQNGLDLDLASALAVLGVCDHLAGQSDSARDTFDRQLSMSDALANTPALAHALWLSASLAFDVGADALAESHLERLESLGSTTPRSALHLAALRVRSAVRGGSDEAVSNAARSLEKCQQAVGEAMSALDSPAAALIEIAERSERSAEGRVT